MLKTRRKIMLLLASVVFVVGSVFTVVSASPVNTAYFDLTYTNSPYGNNTHAERDVYASGAGYDVTVTQLSGTATYRELKVSCSEATGTPYWFSTTGTHHFGYITPADGRNYVTFKFDLIYTAGEGSARAVGSVSKC